MCFDDGGGGCGTLMALSHTLIGLRGDVYVWRCPECGGTSAATVAYQSIAALGRKNLRKKLAAMSTSERRLLPQATRRLPWVAPVGPILESRFHGGRRYEKHHRDPKRGGLLSLGFWSHMPDPVKSGPIPFVAIAFVLWTMPYLIFFSGMRPLWFAVSIHYGVAAAIAFALYRLGLRQYPQERVMALLAGMRSDEGEPLF